MKKLDLLLVVLFCLQLGFWFNYQATTQDIEELVRPKLDFVGVKKIEIIQGRNRIRFEKDRLGWRLPAYKGYLTRERAVESFLSRVTGYLPGPLVGTVEDSAEQFRVSDAKPYCRVNLEDAQGFIHTLFMAPAIGDSDYVRVKGEDKNIYRLEPALSRQLDPSPQAWIEPTLYQMTDVPKAINWSIAGREFRVRYDGRDFRYRNQVLDRQKVIDFVNNMQALPIDEPWGVVPPYGNQKPPMMIFFDIPSQPIRLHVYPQVHPQTGVRGFRVSKDGDPREVFVMPHRFQGIFRYDIGIFLPGNVTMGSPDKPFVNPFGGK